MKYHAIISNTNELIEANSFKELYVKARHIVRSSEQKGRVFLITLARGNKQIGLIHYKSVPDEKYRIMEKVLVRTYIYSGKYTPLCREFAEGWRWIPGIEIEGENF